VAVIYSPVAAPFAELFLRSVETAAKSFGVIPITLPFNDPTEINPALEIFAREPNAGLIVVPDAVTASNRNTIITAAAQHRLPAIYPFRFYAADGGLMSYGSEPTASFQQAASYVDRIIKGAKAGDLPVQTPTKFDFVINLKTAKMLGLEVPFHIQQLADEVIE
jgi:putative ABC transport system substrate-binding protein